MAKNNHEIKNRETEVNEAIFTGIISIAFIFLSLGFFVSKENLIYVIGLMSMPFTVGMARIYAVILDYDWLKLATEIGVLFIVPITMWLVPLLVVNEAQVQTIQSLFPIPPSSQEEILKLNFIKQQYTLTNILANSVFGTTAILIVTVIVKKVLTDYENSKYDDYLKKKSK